MKVRMRTTLAAGVVLMFGAGAHAQVVARTFDELRFKVQPGDIVWVTGAGGEEQRARVLEISNSLLSVSIDDARRDLSGTDVTRIRQRLPDPLWNGAAIGAAAVGGTGIALAAALNEIDNCDAGCWTVNILYSGGIGALMGVGVDALIKGKKTIFDPTRGGAAAQVAVRPLLSSTRKGLSVSVQF